MNLNNELSGDDADQSRLHLRTLGGQTLGRRMTKTTQRVQEVVDGARTRNVVTSALALFGPRSMPEISQ
jgi:hypothetical protein